MPVILLDRLPLPSLKAYSIISVLLLSCSVYYAFQVTSDPNWRINATLHVNKLSKDDIIKSDNLTEYSSEIQSELAGPTPSDYGSLASHLKLLLTFMIQEPLCIWTLINMAYCCLILLGKFIQRLVFGELRVSEQQHIKDKFWNFVFYKFIFIFGVINVQHMDEVVLWCSWFSVLGFLHLLAQLCKDRFEYLSFSPTTSGWSHIRLLSLLAGILMVSGLMFLICVVVGFLGGLNTFSFMVAECIQLSIQTLHVIFRYILHLYDVRHGEGFGGSLWEKRGHITYYTELVFELAVLILDLTHHLHMLVWCNIFLSMASLVICMQLRFVFHEIQRKVKKHRTYLWVLKHMERNYPMASPEELAENSDNCAICWEKMESARKLPCSHLFHNTCLQSWLEQDTSCPTCRMGLTIHNHERGSGRMDGNPGADNDAQLPGRRAPNNHFFHFDGSRYVSWLPSFSVEVTHTQLVRSDQPHPAQTSQLDAMARQVQQLFPHLPLSTIAEDLRISRSVEQTIENVLEGRFIAPPPMFQDTEPLLPEVLPHENETAHQWNDYCTLVENDSAEFGANLSGRFSKSSSEREHMLKLRKDQLLQSARRKYVERHTSVEESSSSCGHGTARRRHESS